MNQRITLEKIETRTQSCKDCFFKGDQETLCLLDMYNLKKFKNNPFLRCIEQKPEGEKNYIFKEITEEHDGDCRCIDKPITPSVTTSKNLNPTRDE